MPHYILFTLNHNALLYHMLEQMLFLLYFDFPVEDSESSLCSAPNTGPGAE